MKKCLEIFVLESKSQLKSVALWLCAITACCISFSNEYLFIFPVGEKDDVREHMFLGSLNKYEISDEQLIQGKMDEVKKEGKLPNPDTAETLREHNIRTDKIFEEIIKKIPPSDCNTYLNSQLKEKHMRFSQMFFRSCSYVMTNEACILPLLVIFLFLLNKDRTSRMVELIGSKPIKTKTYIFSKYMGAFFSYMTILFVSCFGAGIYEKAKCIAPGWQFSMFDIVPAFLAYMMPSMLFITMFMLFLSVLFRNVFVSIPVYVISIGLSYELERKIVEIGKEFESNYRLFPRINWKMFNSGKMQFLPADVALNQCILVVLTVLLFFLTCYFWNKNRAK
ncbi:hypothetical protein FACS189481_4060 [Clostridia bacterium]|nr:hypothetical protein FACS189481_4060 [Clostridia bacterium]